MGNPFKYFNSAPEGIRPEAIPYARYPLSLRHVEDLASERGIATGHETARFSRDRFSLLFAAKTRKERIRNRHCTLWGRPLDGGFARR